MGDEHFSNAYRLDELSIELTGLCNMRCIMCSSGSDLYYDNSNDLSLEEILWLIKQANDMGAKVLSLSGGDPIVMPTESLLTILDVAGSMNFEEILFYTTGVDEVLTTDVYGSHYCISGISNLRASIRDKFSNSLKDKLTFVYSLHSHDPAVNDYIMGRSGAFKAVTRGINLCVRRGYRTWIHMVPMLPNWSDMGELYNFCEKLGVEQMSALRFVPQTRGRANVRQLALNVDEFASMQRMMESIATDNRSFSQKVKFRIGCPIDFRHTVFQRIKDKQHPCHAGKDLILVRPDGSVHPCAAWKTLPKTDNVRQTSLQDIWDNSTIFQMLRRYHEQDWDTVGGVCSRCRFQRTCKSGCIAQRLHAISANSTKPPTIDNLCDPIPDPLCPYAKKLKTYEFDEY